MAGLPLIFGRYVLFDRIGQGGMAEIFLALADTGLAGSRRAVVKRILPRLSEDLAFSEMLIREAKLSARLNHRNIVQVSELGRENGQLYIAMAYVEGYDLNRLLRELSKRRIALPAEFALFIVREILAALDYAHRAVDARGLPLGVVHRDVSPSNVLISFEGEVSLCDFGIARALGPGAGDGKHVASGLAESEAGSRKPVAGKSAYMAPEHAGGAEVDLRSDVFAAGILLWELCAGRRAYRGTDEEMLTQAKAGVVPDLPDRGLPNHEHLKKIVSRALSPDPARRFQSGADMAQALEDYAFSTQLMASQLRFSSFLQENFAAEIVHVRRSREAAAQSLQHSMPATERVESGKASREHAVEAEQQEAAVATGPEEQAVAVDRQGTWVYIAFAVATALAVALASLLAC